MKKKVRKAPRNSFIANRPIIPGNVMKHRLEPKGGAVNKQAKLLEELCPTCNKSYNNGCSNGFHLCKNCTYEDGALVKLCDIHNDDNDQ